MKETYKYDDATDTLVVNTTYDREPLIEQNKAEKNLAPEFGRYKGNLVKAASIGMGDIVRLKNMGYNLLSPDQEEVRRALVYIQQNEPHLMTLPGKPFTKQRIKWM